jgi:cell division protein FtsB
LSEVINPYWGKRGARHWRASQTVRPRFGAVRLSTALYIVITVVLLAACFTYHRQTRSELEAATAKRLAEGALVDKLTVETQRLTAEIQSIKTDPRMIESLARRELGFVRPGDVVIRIIEPGQQAPGPTSGALIPPMQQGYGNTSDILAR